MQVCDAPRGWFKWQGAEARILLIISVSNDFLLCDHNRGGYTLVNQQWRYIHYPDGTEELYQLSKDREEWNNLAGQEKVQPIIDEMKKSAPKSFAPEGLESNKLKLIIEGESFRWEPKPGGRNQAKQLVKPKQ